VQCEHPGSQKVVDSMILPSSLPKSRQASSYVVLNIKHETICIILSNKVNIKIISQNSNNW